MLSVTLFAGPSAHGLPRATLLEGGTDCRPPVKRGDVDRLIEGVAVPGVVVLCDGVFQSQPAVSHAEICRAMDTGWQVWGVSSMGAIRAHELRSEGMHGFGWVYEQFTRHDDFADDELCLMHLPEEPWWPLTEPLVNVRYALAQQGKVLGIGAESQRVLIAGLRDLWFGERSLERVREIMRGPAGIAPAAADCLLAWLDQHRVKSIDLRDLMLRRPWAR